MLKRKIVFISILTIAFLIILFFLSRVFILNYSLHKITNKLKTDYDLNFNLRSSTFRGFRGILMNDILIRNLHNDTIFNCDSVFLQIKPFYLLAGHFRIRKIIINQVKLDLNGEFFDKFLKARKNRIKEIEDSIITNYSTKAKEFLAAVFSRIPKEIKVNSAIFHFKRDKLKLFVFSSGFKLSSGKFEGLIVLSDQNNYSKCKLMGTVNPDLKKIDISFFAANEHLISLPYIDLKWDISVKFSTLRFIFNVINDRTNKIVTDAFFEAENFQIQNKRIAPTPVIINKWAADIVSNFCKDYIEIDSTSKIAVNNFAFSPYLKYEHRIERQFIFRIPYLKFETSEFFKSFPSGLFTSIRNITSSGKLSFRFDFKVNLDHPDSLELYAYLDKEDFKIISFGAANLTMMNDTFSYRIYDDDKPEHNIFIGPENPDFVKLDDISPFLRYSVLTSEDGGFFYHKGFSEEAFKNSIIENIKEKRFARGASTITMQLVKNVYLTRNKTISRKLEEILIVWIIENFHLVSKERMFEVYLNIIEWGPGIYGIKKASWFYFKKKPSDLSLQESIFLASIIPCPKYFKYAFKKPGELTDYYAWFYKRLPEVMLSRNQISSEDTIGLKPEIELTGDANDYLFKADSTVVDSSQIERPILIEIQ